MNWYRRAQNEPQQLWFDFDPPGTFTDKPQELEHPGFQQDVNAFISDNPEQQAEYVDGFYHVTTNLDGVMRWGQLKSRQQLGGTVPGLGGGFKDEASDKVSLTYNYGKAVQIFEALSYAAQIAHGNVLPSAILAAVQEQHGVYEVDNQSAAFGVFRDFGVPKKILRDEYMEGLEAALDKVVRMPKDKYDFMQRLDDAFGRDAEATDSSGEFQAPNRVGFTVPFETFAQIDPQNIAILRMQVRKGAVPEHVNQEMELRFDPDDVRLPMNPVVKREG